MTSSPANITCKQKTVLAGGLGGCRAIGPVADGKTIILDATGGRVLSVAFGREDTVTIASGLSVGYLSEPYPRSGGMAVGADGSIYIAADVENALYRISRAGRSSE